MENRIDWWPTQLNMEILVRKGKGRMKHHDLESTQLEWKEISLRVDKSAYSNNYLSFKFFTKLKVP